MSIAFDYKSIRKNMDRLGIDRWPEPPREPYRSKPKQEPESEPEYTWPYGIWSVPVP